MVEVTGFLKRLLGRTLRPQAEHVDIAGGHLPPGWTGGRPRAFLFGRDPVQDYVEANTRYALSVLEQIEAGRP